MTNRYQIRRVCDACLEAGTLDNYKWDNTVTHGCTCLSAGFKSDTGLLSLGFLTDTAEGMEHLSTL